MCSHNNSSGTSSLEHHATRTPTLHAHFKFCDYLFVSLDSTRNSKNYLYKEKKKMSLRRTESGATATQPYSCTTSSSHSLAALQAADQQLTSENTEACQKVLAQSPALHVCLRRRCTRRSAYPANCQQDSRAECITSAACNNFTIKRRLPATTPRQSGRLTVLLAVCRSFWQHRRAAILSQGRL